MTTPTITTPSPSGNAKSVLLSRPLEPECAATESPAKRDGTAKSVAIFVQLLHHGCGRSALTLTDLSIPAVVLFEAFDRASVGVDAETKRQQPIGRCRAVSVYVFPFDVIDAVDVGGLAVEVGRHLVARPAAGKYGRKNQVSHRANGANSRVFGNPERMQGFRCAA